MQRFLRRAVAACACAAGLAACAPQQARHVTVMPSPAERTCPHLASGRDACRADVLVAGGGLSGVAAAVSAARRGLRVTLLAQEPYLGGIVTAAMMDQWDFNIVAGGRSVQRGQFDDLYARLGDSFTQQDAERVLAAYAARAGVDVLTSTRVVRVATKPVPGGRRLDAVAAQDAGGRVRRYDAACFIDATDDGDVAALAGARYGIGRQDEGRDSKMQAATLLFTIEGLDWPRITASYDMGRYGYGRAIGTRGWGYGTIARAYRPSSPRVAVRDLNLVRHPDGAVAVNSINVFDVDGRSPRSVGEGIAIAKAEAPRLVAYLRTRIAGFEHARVGRFADALYVRETRHVRGQVMLRESDVWERRLPPDTIGLASYPLDTHPVDASDKQRYAPERRVYGVPLGALLPLGFTNLGLASRAISATHVAAGSARIIPTTVEEGEALGAACALARRRGKTLVEIDRDPALLRALRADLRAHGVLLDPPAPAPSSAARVGG
jgi:hypothetical protein